MGSVLVFIAASYVTGSIPTAYIFGKVIKGIDIRKHGSGNVGATNVFRTVGKVPGAAVLILDFLKGLIPVTLFPYALRSLTSGGMAEGSLFPIALGAAAIAGHIWTCFLRFRGGKGVATTAGVVTGLYPGIFLAGLVVWGAVLMVSKYVSLASIITALSLPVLAVIFNKDIVSVIFMAVVAVVGTYSHRSNIRRLILGTENRIVSVKKR